MRNFAKPKELSEPSLLSGELVGQICGTMACKLKGMLAQTLDGIDMAGTTRRVIVVTRNGQQTVITGWRAWLLGLAALLVAWIVLALSVFVLVGVAISVGLALLLLIPAIAIVALVGSLMRREI